MLIMPDIDPNFAHVVKAFSGKRDVTRESGKGFGTLDRTGEDK